MKIITLNWEKSNEMVGGCETVFDNLTKILDANQISVKNINKILTGKDEFTYYPYAITDRVRHTNDFFNVLNRIDKGEKVIISNDCCLPFGVKGAKLITYAQNPYLPIANILRKLNFYNDRNFNEFGNLYNKYQMDQILKSDKVVTVSEYMYNLIKEKTGVEAIIINQGINTDLFKPLDNKNEIKEKLGLPLDKKIGIFVGAFHPVKGYDYLQQLIIYRPDIHWIVVLKHKVNSTIISKNVSIFCEVNQRFLNILYNTADFCFSPSLCEAASLVPMEAMSCNIPVIVTNVGYFYNQKDNITKFGIILDRLDKNTILDSIDKILSIQFTPRKELFKRKLTLEEYNKNWQKLIKTI